MIRTSHYYHKDILHLNKRYPFQEKETEAAAAVVNGVANPRPATALKGNSTPKLKLSQVTYVTMVPRGNETLRRNARGTPSAIPCSESYL